MAFLEDEFLALLDGPRVPKATNAGDCCKTMKRPPSFEQAQHDSDRCVLPIAADAGAGIGETAPPYPPETVDRLRSMADAMVTAGYVTECTQMFLVARRNAFDALLRALGYEKASIDDVVKMTWEALEAEIVAWTKAFRHTINVGLSTEHDLCGRVFAGRHAAVGRGIFADLSRCVMLHMLNFTEAVAMTKRATEKLFKVLDMYEAIRDASPLMEVMELLHGNLEGKSRLYKDPSLSNIFLMNNGRYMLQKIRGSPETNAMLGEAWARKQSTNLRQYHKNYQRETWSRVLGLLRDDGVITVKGSVQKPVLKERFKQFNAAMDEIHRTQGAWVVSDEQLQSELRVSIAAVVVPAYRSFLGRFSQTFSAGRQTEKYVKLSADDVETIIDELFDGNAASMTRRRT
uniref:Exocyst subunit Exo70 family protein n=1 Tax=Oryza brachyantha TaxID=4533 RepID=J3NBN9_ORYBR